MPDPTFTIKNTVATDHRAATEVRVTEINSGPVVLGEFGHALLGADVHAVHGKGRTIDLPAVFVHEVEHGVVVAELECWGLLESLVQVGLIGDQPASASP